MKNSFDEANNQLAQASYNSWQKTLLDVLRSYQTVPLFDCSEKNLKIDADAFARHFQTLVEDHPVIDEQVPSKFLSVNFGSRKKRQQFFTSTKDIQLIVQQLFEAQAQQRFPNISIEDYLAQLITPLVSNTQHTLAPGLQYPFKNPSSREPSLQQLIIDTSNPKNPVLFQGHTVTITLKKTHQFYVELEEGIMRYARRNGKNFKESEFVSLQQRLNEMIHEDTSELHTLIATVSTESLAKIKQEVSIHYLELLSKQVSDNPQERNYDRRSIYLQTLTTRLKKIKEYLLAYPNDTEYQIYYDGSMIDIRDVFSRSNAFDILPVIPMAVGLLRQMTNEDNDTLSFQFGMKVKLNAAVTNANSDSVLDYYLDMIDPADELHQSHLSTDNNALATQDDDYFKQRVLHIACLYMLVFNRFDEAGSPIIDIYRQHVLPVLQSGTDEEKRALFTRIKKQIAGSNKNRAALDDLCELVKEIIRQPKHLYGFQGDPYYVHIGLQAGLLTPNVNTMFKHYQFLSPECRENPKQILRYLTVSGDRIEGTAFCKLPVEISFTSVYFQSDASQDTFQKFTLQYDIDAIDMVPTFFYPRGSKSANRVIKTQFHSQGIFFPYWSTFRDLQEVDKTLKHIKQFAYEWAYAFLAFTCLKVISEYLNTYLCRLQRQLFLPCIRLHIWPEEDKREEERFINAVSYSLSHLLSEQILSNAQGFYLGDIDPETPHQYLSNIMRNALSSLYSILPKKFFFEAPTLQTSGIEFDEERPAKKVALVIVSSRSCDARRGHSFSWINVHGQAIGIEWEQQNCRSVRFLKSFSANVATQKRFEIPPVLVETVQSCYQQGYEHVFYIAKSPYTSTLHLTSEEGEEDLFFMNPRVIQAMKEGYADRKLYPIFFDKYYVVKKKGIKHNSYYIPYVGEIAKLIDDTSKKSVAFFNLLNGFQVNKKEDQYHGIISYSTLLNRFPGVIDDQDIWLGLVAGSKTEPNPLKIDLLQALILFHFARYEQHGVQMFKLDPYEHIIGSESLGAAAYISHSLRRTQFHLLAFLTEMRRVLNIASVNQLLEQETQLRGDDDNKDDNDNKDKEDA